MLNILKFQMEQNNGLCFYMFCLYVSNKNIIETYEIHKNTINDAMEAWSSWLSMVSRVFH